MGVTGFGERLRAAIGARGRLCVGIDPHPGLLADWGLSDDVAGLERFALTVVTALADRVALLKPQAAFFEAHGHRGVAVLERTMTEARAAGALVLLDAKRGDIGSTMAAYARAVLAADAPADCDAVTLSPYLGFDSLLPAIEVAATSGRGVFVLARTSNPEGAVVQTARTAPGATVAQTMVDSAARLNGTTLAGPAGVRGAWGSVGVVIGATAPLDGLRTGHLRGPILVPGVGPQGATAAGLREVFAGDLRQVLPTVSRQVLASGPDVAALRRAAAGAAGWFADVPGTAGASAGDATP